MDAGAANVIAESKSEAAFRSSHELSDSAAGENMPESLTL